MVVRGGCSSVAARGFLVAVASLAVDRGLVGSAVVANGLSCPTACGVFLDQGLILCPLPWQVNS